MKLARAQHGQETWHEPHFSAVLDATDTHSFHLPVQGMARLHEEETHRLSGLGKQRGKTLPGEFIGMEGDEAIVAAGKAARRAQARIPAHFETKASSFPVNVKTVKG